MRISDWSSDVCSSDLQDVADQIISAGETTLGSQLLDVDRKIAQTALPYLGGFTAHEPSRKFDQRFAILQGRVDHSQEDGDREKFTDLGDKLTSATIDDAVDQAGRQGTDLFRATRHDRSEEHTSELQSLMRISYAVFCLNKKNKLTIQLHTH